MPAPLEYRRIPALPTSLPDADWIFSQSVPADVPNVYSLWPQRASIEVVPVWWNMDAAPAGVGAAVFTTTDVTIQPVEVKRVPLDPPTVVDGVVHEHRVVVAAAAASRAVSALTKESLVDTSADEMYLRVAAATAPPGATHLLLVVEVTT